MLFPNIGFYSNRCSFFPGEPEKSAAETVHNTPQIFTDQKILVTYIGYSGYIANKYLVSWAGIRLLPNKISHKSTMQEYSIPAPSCKWAPRQACSPGKLLLYFTTKRSVKNLTP